MNEAQLAINSILALMFLSFCVGMYVGIKLYKFGKRKYYD